MSLFADENAGPASGICAGGEEEVLMNERWNGASIVCDVCIWDRARDLAIRCMSVENRQENERCEETCCANEDKESLYPGRHLGA